MVKKKKLTGWKIVNGILIALACLVLLLLVVDKILHFWFQHVVK